MNKGLVMGSTLKSGFTRLGDCKAGPSATHESNIAHQFVTVALAYPQFPSILSEVTVITYSQLLGASIAFAKRFQKMGIDQTSTIALNTGDMPTSIAALMASSFLGCRIVTAGNVLRKQGIIKPTHFFRTSDAKEMRSAGFVEVDETWFEDAATAQLSDIEAFLGYGSPDDIWQILHTSGTTGKPKFIGLTHRIVTDRTAAISDDFRTTGTTCVMLFNCTSRPFFARAIGALLNACTIVDSSDVAVWRRFGVNTVFCSPSQYRSFVGKYGPPPRFKKVEISGAKLDDELARELSESFDTIVDIYGASETNKTFSNLITVNSAGTVTRKGLLLDSQVEIIDDDGNPSEPGEPGTVRVRNDYMAAGYMSAPEATANNFIDGWFYPGDVATWGANGELDVIGRNDEVMSFGGVKIDSQLIDLIIQSVPGVKDGICFKSPKTDRNEVLAFVVFEAGINKDDCVYHIREKYQSRTGFPCFLGRIHEIDEIPYSENGRPMRNVCQQMIAKKSGVIEAFEVE